eukprot:GHVT01017224.1.p2 GENE.GHVT01017224.1~~GHVT01017224.1.p2  ORF type:complete len:307 (-),score=42.61 GHVT01017224.1:616-1536(-)
MARRLSSGLVFARAGEPSPPTSTAEESDTPTSTGGAAGLGLSGVLRGGSARRRNVDGDSSEEDSVVGGRASSSSTGDLLNPALDGEEEIGMEPAAPTGVLMLHNVMCHGLLGCHVNLEKVCKVLGNAIFDPEAFQCTRIDARLKTGATGAVSIFHNGKISCTGGNSVEDSHRAMKKIARRLRDHPSSRYPIRFSSFEVSNLLATYSVGFPIVLRLLCRLVPNVDYEPERFPAARIKVPMAKAGAEKAANANARRNTRAGGRRDEVVTVNIFSTGNVSFTGGRTMENIEVALETVKPMLEKCRVKGV